MRECAYSKAIYVSVGEIVAFVERGLPTEVDIREHVAGNVVTKGPSLLLRVTKHVYIEMLKKFPSSQTM